MFLNFQYQLIRGQGKSKDLEYETVSYIQTVPEYLLVGQSVMHLVGK